MCKPSVKAIGPHVVYAVAAGNIAFLEKLRGLRYIDPKTSNHVCFIVQGLLQNLKPEPMLRWCKEVNLPLALDAFSVGACGDESTALRTAIKNGHTAMVRLLLEHGVDPEARGDPRIRQSTCELADQYCPEAYDIVRLAVEQRQRRLGVDYVAPTYCKYDRMKNRPFLMQYTFHALTIRKDGIEYVWHKDYRQQSRA